MNEAFWSHFKHFGRLLGKKFICSSLPASLMEEFPASKVHLKRATWLTGKFPSRCMSRRYWPVWVWPKAKIYTFSGGGGGGEKAIRYSVYIALIFIKETWDHFTWHTACSLITNTSWLFLVFVRHRASICIFNRNINGSRRCHPCSVLFYFLKNFNFAILCSYWDSF